jgi:hypothetical protein
MVVTHLGTNEKKLEIDNKIWNDQKIKKKADGNFFLFCRICQGGQSSLIGYRSSPSSRQVAQQHGEYRG